MPMRNADYPQEWKLISLWVRVSASWQCEWCGIRQGALTAHARKTGGTARVVLTVAHLGPNKHNTHDCSNLKALCQACHLSEDMADHIAKRRLTLQRRKEAKQCCSGSTS